MVDFRALPILKQSAKEANPTVSVVKGTPIHDLWLTVCSLLLEPFYFDLEAAFGDGYSLLDFDNLTTEEMETKVGNFINKRLEGNQGSQIARIIVSSSSPLAFGEGELIGYDAEGNQFYNSGTYSFTEAELDLQRDGLLYYFDATFISDQKVSNIGPIVSLDDTSVFSGFVSIQGQIGTIQDGNEDETNESLFYRNKDSIGARNIVAEKGTSTVIRENYGIAVSEVRSIGFGDPEMMRDIPLDDNDNKIINLHMGGKSDVYIKTRSLQRKELDFVDLPYNTNRIATRSQAIELDGLNHIFIGRFPVLSVESVKSITGASLDPSDYSFNLSTGTVAPLLASTSTIVVEYSYNPICIDIRSEALAGRENFTIEDLVLVRIVSVEELDPSTGEPNGVIYNRGGGYGVGGYGLGGYGVGEDGDYSFSVKRPHERFSMLEESWIEFQTKHLGKDVRVTIDYAPELRNIHDFVTNGNERNTVGSVLPKNFLPAFISGTIEVEVSSGNEDAPDSNSALSLVQEFISAYTGDRHMELDKVIEILFQNDIYGLNKCFSMEAEIHHANGAIQKVTGKERLYIPEPTLPKDTDMPISKRIVRFYPGEIKIIVTERSDV